jgi:hypothetical protein
VHLENLVAPLMLISSIVPVQITNVHHILQGKASNEEFYGDSKVLAIYPRVAAEFFI